MFNIPSGTNARLRHVTPRKCPFAGLCTLKSYVVERFLRILKQTIMKLYPPFFYKVSQTFAKQHVLYLLCKSIY